MRTEIDFSLRAGELAPAAAVVLAIAREEVDRMSCTVEDLLTLAAADEGVSISYAEPADLGHTLRQWSTVCAAGPPSGA